MKHGVFARYIAATCLLSMPAAPVLLGAQGGPGYKVLYTFTGVDGSSPIGSLVGDSDGNLYGTTIGGGDTTDTPCVNSVFGFGCGVVYKIDRRGHQSVVYEFKGGSDGAFPGTELLIDAAGNLYGTARGGGILTPDSPCAFLWGCGVVFMIDRNGNESVIYSFTGGADGLGVSSGLIRDSAGNLYGATVAGGDFTNPICQGDGPPPGSGCGVVFKIDARGNETVLHTFSGGTDGYAPYGSLTMDRQGNLFGTTSNGGDEQGAFCGTTVPNLTTTPFSPPATGCGVAFKIDASGAFSVMHTFEGPDGGPFPDGWLASDSAGNLYGITGNGGSTVGDSDVCGGLGCGTIFEIDHRGNESVLYNFAGGSNGATSFGSVVRDNMGNLYGATFFGGDVDNPACSGTGGCGVVFRLDSHGKYSVLHTFEGGADGSNPWASLYMGEDGNLYGTTEYGGDTADPACSVTGGCGVVFRIALR